MEEDISQVQHSKAVKTLPTFNIQLNRFCVNVHYVLGCGKERVKVPEERSWDYKLVAIFTMSWAMGRKTD